MLNAHVDDDTLMRKCQNALSFVDNLSNEYENNSILGEDIFTRRFCIVPFNISVLMHCRYYYLFGVFFCIFQIHGMHGTALPPNIPNLAHYYWD